MTNTLVAVFDETTVIIPLPNISHQLCDVDVIPSIIGYSKETGQTQRCIGMETTKLPEQNISMLITS